MNRDIDKDVSTRFKRVYARTKGIKKGSDNSRRQNRDVSGRKGLLWDFSQGIQLKIQPIWIIVSVIILLGCILLFLRNPESHQKSSSEQMQGTASVPGIKHIHIKPKNPLSNNDLLANVKMKGNSQGKIHFTYQWYKNEVQIDGAKDKRLSHIHFKKGDTIKVKVVPVMQGVEGEPATSSSVLIMNSPPVLKSIVIQPQVAYSNSDLMVEAEAEDPDKELVSLRYQWIKNGSEIYDEESEFLKHSHFVKGDRIQVQVTPFDGYGHGTSMISSIVLINNSAPNIVSHPPSTFEEKGTYVYKVIAEDIDNDILIFSLSSRNPPGATIDPESGLLLWKIPDGLEPGPKRIEIIVSDPDGSEASQWFTLNIQFIVNQYHG